MIETTSLSNKFDTLLLISIDETLNYVLGEINAAIIYRYLEAKDCTKEELPQKLEFFSLTLRDLIGNGRRQMLGAASVLEATIAETFAKKLETSFDETLPINFPEYIRQLKQKYLNK